MKSKAKPVNIKSKQNLPTPPKLPWWKVSVFFKNAEDCRVFSMVLAIKLRSICPMAYFARYMTVVESRADYCFVKPPEYHLREIVALVSRHGKLQFRISDIIPCEGSTAHAMGLDLAIAIWTQHAAVGEGPEGLSAAITKTGIELFADAIHWTTNALGLDYCDEAKLNLYSLDRIVNIFAQSIKLGNAMTTAAKKADKRSSAPERN